MLISVGSNIVGNLWDNVGTGAELNKLYYKGVTKKCYLLYLQIQGKEKSQCFFYKLNTCMKFPKSMCNCVE